MFIRHRDMEPEVDPTAYVAPTAVLVGNVKVGPRARIMYGAVLDAEGAAVRVGECCIVSENVVLRGTVSGNVVYRVTLGDHVFVGPQSTLLGCTVEPCSYIASGATVLQGAVLHQGSSVGVGAVVHAKSVIPQEIFVPPNTIAIGDPATIYSPDEKVTITSAIHDVQFGTVAFGVDATHADRMAKYRQVTEIRSRDYESHFGDAVVGETKRTGKRGGRGS